MDKLLYNILCQIGGCTDCNDFSTCGNLKFALISMIFGFLCVFTDFLVFKLVGLSYLKLSYVKNILFIFIFWTLGSLIIGYIGAAAELFDTSKIFSALFVGVSWQFVFARWVAGKFENEDVQPENAR